MRIKLTLAYRGTAYHGWQAQGDDVGLPTVQDAVRRALVRVVGHPVTVVGASRTDAGVHAKGQIAHFDTHHEDAPPEGLRKGLNSRLPGDVVAVAAGRVADDFDAITDAVTKRYQYQFYDAADKPVFLGDLAFHRPRGLDHEAMDAAAARLVGTHDFTSFARPGHGRATTVRAITACRVSRRGPRVILGVEGTGFLWNQVRIIAGTLADAGANRLTPDDVTAALQAKNRRAAGPTAPAHGLFLQWIRHREGG